MKLCTKYKAAQNFIVSNYTHRNMIPYSGLFLRVHLS